MLFVLQQDGKRYYKVKWVRFTWELEETINIKLKDLVDAFWAEHGGDPNEKDKLQQNPCLKMEKVGFYFYSVNQVLLENLWLFQNK